ncbi:uncharacterized protein L201_000379 [Kwoniella dendrophila CBS 6074]|uniref:RRN6 beta-propeller domain-containing protein n=1 Tax=Kwoniella dendrophila CBS 6074 TaxID=1295534 RepID=A0AAX4JLT5_9TREE
MTFPSSVEHLPLPRSRRHGRRKDKYQDEFDYGIPQHIEEKTVEVRSEVGVGGPILDFGRSGGVTLEKGKKGWNWVWASEDRKDLRYVAGDSAVCLFPATRSLEKQLRDVPLKDQLDASAKHIESLFSPYERYGLHEALISVLDEDEGNNEAGPSNTSKLPGLPIPERDIYSGPKLAIIENPRARIAKTLLAFPVGEVGHHLNISPFLPANSRKVDPRCKLRFVPTHRVVERFPTPILQIVSSPVVSSSRIDREATALLVRLQSTTHLLNLVPDHTYVPPNSQPPIISQRTASLSYEDTEGRRHVDVAIDPTLWSRILIIDESGGVWLWWEEKENRNSRIEKAWNLRKVRNRITEDRHQFFRIAFGAKPGTALTVSSKEAVIIDLDDPAHPSTTLLSLRGKDRQFASIDKTALQRGSQHTVLSTNYEVMWIDEGKPGSPIMSWKHDFGSCADLEVGVIPGLTNKDSCTILYSSTQKYILAFPTISYDRKFSQFRSLSHPYALVLPVKELGSLIGFSPASFRHSKCMIGLAENGAIYSIPITSSQNHTKMIKRDGEQSITELRAAWDDHVEKLLCRVKGPQYENEDKEKKGRELDFRWAWLEINQPLRMKEEDVYLRPQDFEQYLREMDAPLEHLMTAGDLARDSVYPEPINLQSHLLNSLPIHPQAPTATIESLSQIDVKKHFPVISTLSPNLPMFHESQPCFQSSDESFSSPLDVFENLKRSFPAQSIKKEDIAQLSADLSLSRTIISSEPINLPQPNNEEEIGLYATQLTEPDELFARAAGKLSLNDHKEPPDVKFNFLHPKFTITEDQDGEREENISNEKNNNYNQEDLKNLTLRNLMNDWKLGENPSEFHWTSWRKDDITNENQTQHRNNGYYKPSYSQPERIIKPLPSSFTSPMKYSQPSYHNHSQSQLDAYNIPSLSNGNYPQPHSQPHLYSQPNIPKLGITPSVTSLPNVKNLPPDLGLSIRSSPPPQISLPQSQTHYQNLGSSQPEESIQFASTQVERGPFGGRDVNKEKKKKKEKKRIGGF